MKEKLLHLNYAASNLLAAIDELKWFEDSIKDENHSYTDLKESFERISKALRSINFLENEILYKMSES